MAERSERPRCRVGGSRLLLDELGKAERSVAGLEPSGRLLATGTLVASSRPCGTLIRVAGRASGAAPDRATPLRR
jgi:hypothetical protein